MDDKLFEIICCPETHQPLRRADVELVTNLNQRIEAGTLFDRVEEKVGQRIDGGLLREDGKILYPIRQNIPTLLIEQGIPLGH
ncbi:MAG: Trm112 family protein [Verrucomicrobiota bacterium]|nr:Trm112 family protein [Verrucomicrobiota bacterium]